MTTTTGKRVTRLVEQNAVEPWREEIRLTMRQVLKRHPGWSAITDPVFIHLVFSFPHSASSRRRGDIWYDNTPDLDKVIRAFGDAISIPKTPPAIGAGMPPNRKQRVRAEYRDNQARTTFLADDRLIVGGLPLKMYCGAPGALSHPGVACSIYRAPDSTHVREVIATRLAAPAEGASS